MDSYIQILRNYSKKVGKKFLHRHLFKNNFHLHTHVFDYSVVSIIRYGITGCGVFKAGIQNWKGFCIKINCSQVKLLNSENWTNGEPQ